MQPFLYVIADDRQGDYTLGALIQQYEIVITPLEG